MPASATPSETPAQPPAPSRSPSTSAAPTPAPASAAPSQTPQPQPNPLDRLSQQDLRIKLDSTRRELRAFIDRKKKIDRDLANLESSIYAFEGSYLSDQLLGPPPASANQSGPAQFGNIIKGYDAYLKAPQAGADRKRARGGDDAKDSDRLFSRSSATYQKALDLRTAEVAAESGSDDEGTGRRKKRH